MGGGHFDALEMLLLMRLRTKSRLSPTHCVRPGRDALSRAGGAHIATSCCEEADLQIRDLIVVCQNVLLCLRNLD